MSRDESIEPFFAAFYPESWEEAKHIGDRMRVRYAFRGQSNDQWRLASHLERAATRNGLPLAALPDQESWILHEFRRRAHQFLDDPAATAKPLDMLALIQHHGGATRLLDFTYSFYVGAFFAVDRAHDDSAVWAVDLDKLASSAAELAGFPGPERDRRMRNERHEGFCTTNLLNPSEPAFVIDVEPFTMNLRMAAQQGLFLYPTRVDLSFEENLFGGFGVSPAEAEESSHIYGGLDEDVWPSVAKIYLPQVTHGAVVRDLHTMNVTAFSLFGGLDGLARSLDRYLLAPDSESEAT